MNSHNICFHGEINIFHIFLNFANSLLFKTNNKNNIKKNIYA